MAEIHVDDGKTVRFGDIDTGDMFFNKRHEVLMKIVETIDEYNAVNLEDGDLYLVDSFALVTPLNGCTVRLINKTYYNIS